MLGSLADSRSVSGKVRVPNFQLCPIVGFDGNEALNDGAGVVLTFSAGNQNTVGGTAANFTALTDRS